MINGLGGLGSMGVMAGLIPGFVDAFQVLDSERDMPTRVSTQARCRLWTYWSRRFSGTLLGKSRTSTESGLLGDISLDAGGGMLEVQMETWSPLEPMSGLQVRMLQEVAVLVDGDFEDEVLVRRRAARA